MPGGAGRYGAAHPLPANRAIPAEAVPPAGIFRLFPKIGEGDFISIGGRLVALEGRDHFVDADAVGNVFDFIDN